MKNTIAMCLISDMDYVQQQRMTKHHARDRHGVEFIEKLHLLQLFY